MAGGDCIDDADVLRTLPSWPGAAGTGLGRWGDLAGAVGRVSVQLR